MRKLTMTLTTAALLLGATALQAGAQNQQRGAASIHALKNATPIVTPAASAPARPVAFPAGEQNERKSR